MVLGNAVESRSPRVSTGPAGCARSRSGPANRSSAPAGSGSMPPVPEGRHECPQPQPIPQAAEAKLRGVISDGFSTKGSRSAPCYLPRYTARRDTRCPRRLGQRAAMGRRLADRRLAHPGFYIVPRDRRKAEREQAEQVIVSSVLSMQRWSCPLRRSCRLYPQHVSQTGSFANLHRRGTATNGRHQRPPAGRRA
jgi:hypothetical protein